MEVFETELTNIVFVLFATDFILKSHICFFCLDIQRKITNFAENFQLDYLQNMKRKIINDPIHGFISIPNDFLYEILQHRFTQRLNRIRQLGVASLVYPCATHTRFSHSLGAMFLTNEAIKNLRLKGHQITDNEADAVMAAILLHDIGHYPYSHLLENTLIQGVSHEQISVVLMEKINAEMGGKLDLAIRIFKNRYQKNFLHQLISSQLDMDRMDYLMRDSYFTGVVEGTVGSARIIKMFDIVDDNLVLEQKGILSVENYLIARRFMYWQVYFHKTSIAAEMMLKNILNRAKELCLNGEKLFATPSLLYFLKNNNINAENFLENEETIEYFVDIDDSDIVSAIKVWANHSDKVLSILCKNFTNRVLFKTSLVQESVDENTLAKYAYEKERYIVDKLRINAADGHYFSGYQIVENDTYNLQDNSIMVLLSDGSTKDLSQVSTILTPNSLNHDAEKNYLCYYKL